MVSISVAGTASRTVAAERGTVHLTVRVEREDSASAVGDAAALSADVVARAKTAVDTGVATRWAANQVTVTTARQWIREGESRVVHVATASIEARFRDFAALGRWSADAGAVDGVLIERVEWSLTAATRAETERTVRVEAVADALVRACDYARALGADDVVVERLAEPGTAPRGAEWQAQSQTRAVAMSGRSGSFELAPGGIEVSATVLLSAVTA